MKKYVLIVAGGKGLRMGNDLPKQFIPLHGKPVLIHTLEAFHNWDPGVEIILVIPKEQQDYWQMLCREIGCKVPHTIAPGGETRFHSVKNGLQHVKAPGLVAVHDGVRPFVSPEVITNCFEEAGRANAAIPVIPMIDSIREVTAGGSRPADRNRFVAVQTPQVFRSQVLLEAYRQPYQETFTDDASVVEAMGIPVSTVDGNRENIKITTPFDLTIAKAFYNQQHPGDYNA
ncbi:MAG: 2-C-methyl-D-erythritol 4-phosphate cytidylyltransferase [Tannerellaceae bacterium]|nr:2-C-methyl-D-erythritol 4-phosphate cytidylyltransferase [Tannerellaceae bacterium]